MKKYFYFTLLVTLMVTTNYAQQFDLSAEIRPRFENKHGYGSLLATDADGSNFISQRSRLNFNFSQDKINLGVSLQNVRVWGDISTLGADDNATMLHEAWAEALICNHFSLKFGRQEIVYDDSRIFGNVGWAQQARSHDAMIAKFKLSEKSNLDLGFALNSDTQAGVDNLYSNVAGYKTFQYAWYHTSLSDGLGLSLLALNNGIEYLDGTNQGTKALAFPNPSVGMQQLKFKSNGAHYEIFIVNQQGKVEAKIHDAYLGAGQQILSFNLQKLAAGTYYYLLKSAEKQELVAFQKL